MKMQITDLLDDYSPDDTLPVSRSKDVRLSNIKSRVRRQIKNDEGEFTMKNVKWRLAIVLSVVMVMSLCTVTANALTNGTIFNTVHAWIVGEDGTRIPFNGNIHIRSDGDSVTEYEGIGTLNESADGSSASFESNGSDSGSVTISSEGEKISEVVIDPNGKEAPELTEHFKDAKSGTYEYTDKNGKVYVVTVDGNGGISAKLKDSK